jgi:hypothetical protein
MSAAQINQNKQLEQNMKYTSYHSISDIFMRKNQKMNQVKHILSRFTQPIHHKIYQKEKRCSEKLKKEKP